MTRQELIGLLAKAWHETPGRYWPDTVADAVIAAGFPVDPEPVTITIPHDVARAFAERQTFGPTVHVMQVACREALGMEP